MTTKKWVERWDVAQLLEKNIDVDTWKGDEHTKGVFFTDDYGYTLNKILAIRVRHHEAAPEVFYSFNAASEECSVTTDYPFENMKLKPKKHHLLFKDEKLDSRNINQIFEVKITHGIIKINPSDVRNPLESISNKRERERASLSFDIKEDGKGEIEIFRVNRKQREVYAKKEIELEIMVRPDDGKLICGVVNAHSLLYLLGIFSAFPYVLFKFGRDRIKITGGAADQTPDVEVVISYTKG